VVISRKDAKKKKKFGIGDKMNYEIWHDEHKGYDDENEYWHGIFFVPNDKKNDIISLLKQIRKEHNISNDEINKFAGSLKKKKRGEIIRNLLDLFTHLLIINNKKAYTSIYNRTKKDEYLNIFNPFIKVSGVYNCKLILFYIPQNHNDFNKYPIDYASRVERTFNMGFKGGAHLLFSNTEPINIVKFYFDGYKHHRRNINIYKITKGHFRDYCNIDFDCSIDDRQMKDRDNNSKIMMSFVDNILGAWVAKLRDKPDPNLVLFPLNDIYERLKNNKILKNINGKWYKSISISKMEIINGEIKFPKFFQNDKQMNLFK